MKTNVTMQPVEVNELTAIEGGVNAGAHIGEDYGLWRAIKNNGGFVGPMPLPAPSPAHVYEKASPDHIE